MAHVDCRRSDPFFDVEYPQKPTHPGERRDKHGELHMAFLFVDRLIAIFALDK